MGLSPRVENASEKTQRIFTVNPASQSLAAHRSRMLRNSLSFTVDLQCNAVGVMAHTRWREVTDASLTR